MTVNNMVSNNDETLPYVTVATRPFLSFVNVQRPSLSPHQKDAVLHTHQPI